MTDQTDTQPLATTEALPDPRDTCCGKSLWKQGGPFVLACKLCPASPMYHGRPEPKTLEEANAGH